MSTGVILDVEMQANSTHRMGFDTSCCHLPVFSTEDDGPILVGTGSHGATGGLNQVNVAVGLCPNSILWI